MFNLSVLCYGCVLALVDVAMMPITKLVAKKAVPLWLMIIPTLLYALDPWIFLQSLRVETMVVMNFVWNLISNILIIFTGFVLFGEKLTTMKGIGVGLSVISLMFLTYE
jgi:multidrug transporter EmrE-like cation transporter